MDDPLILNPQGACATSLEDRADKIRKILKERYPDVKTQLNFSTPFQLLVATILSAQCTDKQVNKVTKTLFKELSNPMDYAEVESDRLEELIRSTGYYRNKAKNVKNCARAILNKHGGTVPNALEELVKLPGVGRKTANVVLGTIFKTPAIVVDTHVSRISRRLGFTRNKDPVKIEFDLMKIIPKHDWDDFSLRLIYFGREICQARKPRCEKCPVYDWCVFPNKTA